MLFSDEGEKTGVSIEMLFPSQEQPDEVAARVGAAKRLEENLDKLGEFLSGTAAEHPQGAPRDLRLRSRCGAGGAEFRRRNGEPQDGIVEIPQTQYTKTSDGVWITYQVAGDGPIDIVMLHSANGSNMEIASASSSTMPASTN